MMRVSSRQVSETVFEVLIAVLLKIQIVWDGILCWTAPHSRRPESSVNNAVLCREKVRLMYTASTRTCHALLIHARICLINYKTLVCKTWGSHWCLLIQCTVCLFRATRHNVPVDLNLHVYACCVIQPNQTFMCQHRIISTTVCLNSVTLQVGGHVRGSITYQYSKSNTWRFSLFRYQLYSMEQVSLPTLSDTVLTWIQDEVFPP